MEPYPKLKTNVMAVGPPLTEERFRAYLGLEDKPMKDDGRGMVKISDLMKTADGMRGASRLAVVQTYGTALSIEALRESFARAKDEVVAMNGVAVFDGKDFWRRRYDGHLTDMLEALAGLIIHAIATETDLKLPKRK